MKGTESGLVNHLKGYFLSERKVEELSIRFLEIEKWKGEFYPLLMERMREKYMCIQFWEKCMIDARRKLRQTSSVSQVQSSRVSQPRNFVRPSLLLARLMIC